MSSGPYWRVGLALVAVAAYAAGSHWLMLHLADQPVAIAVLLGPLLATAFGIALKRRQPAAVAMVLLLVLLLGLVVARGGAGSVNRLYVAQHVGIHLLLLATFAGTLRGNGLSLIGTLAQRVHPLTPAMVRYTRSVTIAWSLYFLAMPLLSLAVYGFGSWEAWSLLANLGTPLAIAALFLGEHLLRYRIHPEFERTRLIDALRAWERRPATDAER